MMVLEEPKNIFKIVAASLTIFGTFGFTALIVNIFYNPKIISQEYFDFIWITALSMVIGMILVKIVGAVQE